MPDDNDIYDNDVLENIIFSKFILIFLRTLEWLRSFCKFKYGFEKELPKIRKDC